MTRALFSVFCAMTLANAAGAQTVREQCADPATEGQFCRRLVDAAFTPPARLAITASGGSPMAGSASTLGMRLPGSPRVSGTLRGTLARLRVPVVDDSDDRGTQDMTVGTVALDAAVGVFHGWNLAPTIGGFASVDALASIGLLNSGGSDEFELGSAVTWGAGVRIGILRESFTAPGVSVSALYRKLPDVHWRQPVTAARYDVVDLATWSVRGTVGKRVLGFGVTGGVAWDRVTNDVAAEFFVPSPIVLPPERVAGKATDARTSFFGNLSYTTTILNFVLETGWQQDGERAGDAHRRTRRGGLFGGAAVRLAI